MKTDRSFTCILKELAEGSSLHGIPKTVSSKQLPVKIMWCLLFIATFVVFGLQLYNLFSAYYSWPIQTTVSLQFSPLNYPAVTFCNMNPVKLTKIDSYPALKEVIKPKVKKKAQSENRKKREAPVQSSIPVTSVPQTSRDAMPSSSEAGDFQTSTADKPTPALTTEILATPITSVSDSRIQASIQASSSIMTSFPDGSSAALTIQNSASVIDSADGVSTGNIRPTSIFIAPSSVSAGLNSASSGYGDSDYDSEYGSGSGSGSDYSSGSGDSYYYDYDYWGSWWYYDYSYNYSDYDSASGYDSSGYFGDFYSGYSENHDTNYGLTSYVYDQLNSPKDQWDERIVKFQAKFKNESLDHREDMGHLVTDMVVSASFASSIQNVSKFERVVTTEYGNCYTMTSQKYIAMRSGPTHGIKLTLNLEMDEYIKNFASGYGIRMVFHEPGTFPLPADEGMTLSPGYETSIGLRMVKVGRLGPPHGHCSDGAEFFKKYKIRYSVTACMLFCRVHRTIKNCGCIPADSPDLNITDVEVDICYSDKHKKCQLAVDLSFDDGSAVEKCDCVSPCKEVVYQKTMSGRRWPNDDYLENVLMGDICNRNMTSMAAACTAKANNSFDADKYRYNFLRVLIYFEDLNYERIEQEPLYEGVRFLSDIGGAMGLFLGASLLSFVEVLQLLLEIVLFVFRAKLPQNQVGKLGPLENRKNSLYPQPAKIRTTMYDETNPNPDPHAVNNDLLK